MNNRGPSCTLLGCDQRGAGEGFPKSDRLRRRAEFVRVQNGGSRVHTRHFVIMVSPGPRQRLGVTVTKRVSGAAVGRNRIKRVVREVFRRERSLFPERCELVVVARRGADDLGYHAVLAEFTEARQALLRAAGGSQRRQEQSC